VSGRGSDAVVPFVTTGILGSYTTFSILSVETLALVEDGRALTAATYGASSMAIGYALALFGIRLGKRRR
jgi:fluoride exporter